jgi:hypothetical protein
MNEYINKINKVAEFVYNNSNFCKSLDLILPIPGDIDNHENIVCWYPASGSDLAPLEQDIYLPNGGKMHKVKTFLYVDQSYDFEKIGDSGLYSVVYRHNGSLGEGILGRYLGFKCVLHVFGDNKVCIFINSDVRFFEEFLIYNKVKVDLVCFLPYGVLPAEYPCRLAQLNAQFFIGSLPSLEDQDLSLEIIQPELNYEMSGGSPFSCSLQKIVPLQTDLSPREKRIKAIRSLITQPSKQKLLHVQPDVLQILDYCLMKHNNLTIKELLKKFSIELEESGDEFIIKD